MERKKRIQEKIAEFRLIRFQKEQDKLRKEHEDAAAERDKLERAAERRRKYMDAQKAKLAEYQLSKHEMYESVNLQAMERKRKMQVENRRRQSPTYDQQKAMATYRAQKQKAEEMLLMAPQGSPPTLGSSPQNRTAKEELEERQAM